MILMVFIRTNSVQIRIKGNFIPNTIISHCSFYMDFIPALRQCLKRGRVHHIASGRDSSLDLIFSKSTHLISQSKIVKNIYLHNSRHSTNIFEIEDNPVQRINDFISRKLLLDRLANVN